MHFQVLRYLFFVRTQLNANRCFQQQTVLLYHGWYQIALRLAPLICSVTLLPRACRECCGDVNIISRQVSYFGWVCLHTMPFMNASGYLQI